MNMRTALCAFLLALCFASPAHSQTQGKLVFAFIGIKATADLETETGILESRILADLTTLGIQENFAVITPRNREEILKEIEFSQSGLASGQSRIPAGNILTARGLVAGQLNKLNGVYYFNLQIIKVETMETINAVNGQQAAFENLVEKSREIVWTLYGFPVPRSSHNPADPSAEPPRAASERPEASRSEFARGVTLASVVGMWKGDKGIETVRIQNDGTGRASLGGGYTMAILIEVTDDQVIVVQNEANSPKLYLSAFPYHIASQLAKVARPMRWVFALSRDGNTLRGIKETTFIRVDRERISTVDNSYSREAIWTRM